VAYSFAAASTDRIECGTDAVPKANTWSIFVRLKVNSSNTSLRRLCEYGQTSGGFRAQMYSHFNVGTNVLDVGHSISGGFIEATWTTGWTAGSTHTYVGVNTGTDLVIYADTDASAKSTASGFGGNSDQDSGQAFTIGNLSGFSDGADGVIYEVGWWAGTVLTGAQAAKLGAGNPSGVPTPTNYWGLINSAKPTFGTVTGTVTGATLVAHAGNNVYRDTGGMLLTGVGS